MEVGSATNCLRSRQRSSATLGFLCAIALVLTGCGVGRDTARPVASGLSALPHSMKGYELYSWQEGKEWRFTLITGTNRLKGYEEVVLPENVVTEADWVELSVQGMENLKAVLNWLPRGEEVTWNGDARLEGEAASTGKIRLPDPKMVEEIEGYCRCLGIQLWVAN